MGAIGGILIIFDFAGGVVLMLLIGKQAAKKNSPTARWWRIFFGAALIGILLGFATLFIYVANNYVSPHDQVSVITFFLFVAPILTLLVACALEGLRKRIDKSKPDPD